MNFNNPKYTGKTFGEVSKMLEEEKGERFDPISMRGLMAKMKELRTLQDQKKAEMEAEQQQQMLEQQSQPQIDPSGFSMNNMGVQPQMGGQPEGGFSREASQSYNQQFAYGGMKQYFGGGDLNDGEHPFITSFKNSYLGQGLNWLNNATSVNMKNLPPKTAKIYLEGDNTMGVRHFKPGGLENYIPEFNNMFPSQETKQSLLMQGLNNPLGLGNTQMPSELTNEQIIGREAFLNDNYNNSPTSKNTIKNSNTPSPNQLNRINEKAINISSRNLPDTQLNFDFLKNTGLNTVNQNNQSFKTNKQNSQNSATSFKRDPLSFAPVLGGALALLNNKRSAPIERNFIDSGLSNQISPRQTQFSNVDLNPIERGIQNQARSFTGSNINVSGGNAGQFIANELGNQSNVMNAIAQARMQGQMQDQQTQAMNAQEQARIDQFNQAQNQQQQSVQGMNAQLALQYQDLDDRNEAAFRTNQNNALQTILGTLGGIGRENTLSNMILAGTGYDKFGQFGGQGINSIKSLLELFKRK